MKRIHYLFLLAGIGVAALLSKDFFQQEQNYSVRAEKHLKSAGTGEDYAEIKPAIEHLSWYRTNPATGKFDIQDYYNALAEINARPLDRRISSPFKWVQEGPDNIGGRTRAFLIDKDDKNLMFTGGVSGGLFRSTTGGASWQPVNDFQDELHVVSITQDKDGYVYYGVGEGAFVYNSYVFNASGVYKADNREGTSFSKLPKTASWDNVSTMAADHNAGRVYAGSNSGFYYSEDGGTNWTKVDQGSSIGQVKDIVVASNGNVFVFAGNRVFKSVDGKTEFSRLDIPFTDGYHGSVGRIELAVAPQDPNYVYALVSTSVGLGNLNGIYKSTDGGSSWSLAFKGGSPYLDPLSQIGTLEGQGTYDLTVSVDPEDKDHIYYGGVQMAEYHPNYGTRIIGSLTASVANRFYVHADKHLIEWDMSTTPPTMIVGTDGGLYFSYDKGRTYQRKNFGYITTQFYGVAANSQGDVFGGTQDNGCIMITHNGNAGSDGVSLNGERLLSGDGFQTEYSRIHNEYVIGESQYGNIVRSADGGREFNHFWDEVVGEANDDVSRRVTTNENWAPFDAQLDLYEWDSMITFKDTFQVAIDTTINGKDTVIIREKVEDKDSTLYTSRLFYSKNSEIWMVDGVFDFINFPRWFKIASGFSGRPEDLEISPDGNTLYLTTRSNEIYRIDLSAADFSSTGEEGSRNILPGITRTEITTPGVGLPSTRSYTSVSVDPMDVNHILVTAGNYGSVTHVFESFNAMDATPTFSSIDNNLPNMPIYDGCLAHINGKLHYILGTEFGVWASDDGGATWDEENTGLARVPVYHVRQYQWHSWREPSIFIGTYGRGIYSHNSPFHVTSIGDDLVEEEENAAGKDVALKAYPNPSTNYVDVEFYSKGNEEVSISIYNISGKKVKVKEIADSRNGKNISRILTGDLPAGNYFLRVKGRTDLGYAKLVVLN